MTTVSYRGRQVVADDGGKLRLLLTREGAEALARQLGEGYEVAVVRTQLPLPLWCVQQA